MTAAKMEIFKLQRPLASSDPTIGVWNIMVYNEDQSILTILEADSEGRVARLFGFNMKIYVYGTYDEKMHCLTIHKEAPDQDW